MTVVPSPPCWTDMALRLEPCRHEDARERIAAFEEWLRTQERYELPVRHFNIPGVIMRECFIPKGCALTGKIHKDAHVFIMLEGVLSVYSEHGEGLLKAGDVVESKPGAKRCGYAFTDVRCLTVHASSAATWEEAEKDLVAESYEEYERQMKSIEQHGGEL